MAWYEALQATMVAVSVIFSLVYQAAWIYLAWRFLSWLMYERVGIQRDSPDSLRFMVRRIVCRHRRGYASVRDRWHRQYTACAYCGADVNAGKRQEDRV